MAGQAGKRGGKVVHGHAVRGNTSPEYFIYLSAKRRCESPAAKDYKHYGGRGIEMRFTSFSEFYTALGPKPSPRHTVDRIDNNGHYEPDNVRWATWSEQRANQRAGKRKRTPRQRHLNSQVGKSGFTGVAQRGKRWGALIYVGNQQEWIGTFADPTDAARAYDARAKQIFGDAATLNYPELKP